MKPEDETRVDETTASAPTAEETAAAENTAAAEGAPAPAENEEDYFAPVEVPLKKPRVKRKDLPPAERKRRNIRDIVITCTVCGVILVFFAVLALCSFVGYTGNYDYIENTVEALP